MKGAKVGLERIKKTLLRDKAGSQEEILAVLKSDACELLDCYFEVDPQSIRAEVDVEEFGCYEIKLSARAFRVRGAFSRG